MHFLTENHIHHKNFVWIISEFWRKWNCFIRINKLTHLNIRTRNASKNVAFLIWVCYVWNRNKQIQTVVVWWPPASISQYKSAVMMQFCTEKSSRWWSLHFPWWNSLVAWLFKMLWHLATKMDTSAAIFESLIAWNFIVDRFQPLL